MWRWARRGVKARNGERVHLEHVRYGGKLFTTKEALERFAANLAKADAEHFDRSAPAVPKPRTRSESKRRRETTAAKQRLAADGLMAASPPERVRFRD